MEDELAGNLRAIKPMGPADLLVDRYDTVFRRNLIEPEAPEDADKKRVKKAKYKWHNREGKAKKEEMQKEVLNKKKELDQL